MNAEQYKKMIEGIVVPAEQSKEQQAQCYQPLIDFLEKETPKQLYRFRCCDARSIEAFDKRRLYFSPPSEMNDSFDSMLYYSRERIKQEFKKIIENGSIPYTLQSIKQSEQLPREIAQILPVDMQKLLLNKIRTDSLDNISDRLNDVLEMFLQNLDVARDEIQGCVQQGVRVACFSTAIESPVMWGYYADSGKGFALAYDFRGAGREYIRQEFYLARVIYDKQLMDASLFAAWLLARKIAVMRGLIPVNQNTPEYIFPCPDLFMSTKILLHKAHDWHHEKEWRLIYSNPSPIKHPYIEIDPVAIYLGSKVSEKNEKFLKSIANERKIPVYKMTVQCGEPRYKLFPNQIS